MLTITKEQQKEFKEAYNNHFAGKNWGVWNMDKAPALGVGYQLIQYENDKGEIADVIKFDQKVQLENKRFPGQTYVLSKAMPNHRTNGYFYHEPPEVTQRTCKGCGETFPVNETGRWYSTNYCIECANERETEIFETFQAMKAQRGDNPQNRAYWIHWAQNHGGGNNIPVERLIELWEKA